MKRKNWITWVTFIIAISLVALLITIVSITVSHLNGSDKAMRDMRHSFALKQTAEKVILMQGKYGRQAVTLASAAYYQGDQTIALIQCYVSDTPGKEIYGSDAKKIVLPNGVTMDELKGLFFYNKYKHILELLDKPPIVVAERRK